MPNKKSKKTIKDIIIKILCKDIDIEAGGGKAIRMNIVAIILIIIFLVAGLVILEKAGVIDDFIKAKHKSNEFRR